jgi:NADH-quinone oxidoreductase subunit H
VWLQWQDMILEERRRLRWEGKFIHPADIIYDNNRNFDKQYWGVVYLWVVEVNLLKFAKWFLLALFAEYCSLSFVEHICLIISVISCVIIVNNIWISITLFYAAYKLKLKLLTDLDLLWLMWSDPHYFLRDVEELYWLHEFQIFVGLFLWKILFGILLIVPILLLIAYATLLEWKILSAIQRWRGPNKVGIKGSTQPLIDGVKLILKEIIIPVQAETKIFIIAAVWSIFFMLLLWFVVPTSRFGNIIQFNYELLALFCISVLGSISILLAGWASNSKYAFLGGVWAGAQIISYELVLGLITLIVMTVTGSTQLSDIVEFQEEHGPLFIYLPLEASLFLILIVAETNWAPFDFAEAESELVSGYNTEYSGLPFAFFFIAEYGNILYMSLLTSLLFFGGWSPIFVIPTSPYIFFVESAILWSKTILIYIFFLWLWGALPWYWYDQLMALCWKIFLPIVLLSLVIWLVIFLSV